MKPRAISLLASLVVMVLAVSVLVHDTRLRQQNRELSSKLQVEMAATMAAETRLQASMANIDKLGNALKEAVDSFQKELDEALKARDEAQQFSQNWRSNYYAITSREPVKSQALERWQNQQKQEAELAKKQQTDAARRRALRMKLLQFVYGPDKRSALEIERQVSAIEGAAWELRKDNLQRLSEITPPRKIQIVP